MLKKLAVKYFSAFRNSEFEFGPGINVVLGINGAGKSHVLKLVYSAVASSYQAAQENKPETEAFERLLQEKLLDVFRAERLKNLAYHGKKQEVKQDTEVRLQFSSASNDFSFYFSGSEEAPAIVISEKPKVLLAESPIFIPTREILSIMPAFARFRQEKSLLLDGTYFDLSFFIEQNVSKSADSKGKSKINPDLKRIGKRLNELLDGKVIQEGGSYYLSHQSGHRLEMPLVAEGLRKIAMLSQLIENGAIKPGVMLLWDEPEANLNPLLMTELADVLVTMSRLDMQIFIATHSLFFLRELHIRLSKSKQEGRYFALDKQDDGINVSQANSIDDIEPIAALDADLQQTDRYMELEI